MPFFIRSTKSKAKNNANHRVTSAANQIREEANALGHVKAAAHSIALEAHRKGAASHGSRRLVGGASRKTRRKRVTRKQRGGLFGFGGESTLMTAAKAGRLTTEGKGKRNSVLEILNDLIFNGCPDTQHEIHRGFYAFNNFQEEFTGKTMKTYLALLDTLSPKIQKCLSDKVSEKLSGKHGRYTTVIRFADIVPSHVNNMKRNAMDENKHKIVEILSHILQYNSKGVTNPAHGLNTPPHSPKKVFNNPLHGLKAGLPPGWEEVTDPEDGAPYFYNPSTGESRWTLPEM